MRLVKGWKLISAAGSMSLRPMHAVSNRPNCPLGSTPLMWVPVAISKALLTRSKPLLCATGLLFR